MNKLIIDNRWWSVEKIGKEFVKKDEYKKTL
jgi:hypothetical protein